MSRNPRLKKSVLVYAFSIIFIAILWQILSALINNPLILPSLAEIFSALLSLLTQKTFYMSLGSTMLRVLQGFLSALISGTLLGLASGKFSLIRNFLKLPLAFIRSIPVVSFILAAIFIFDSSAVPVFSAFLMGVPLMCDAVSASFDFTDSEKKLFQMAETYELTDFQKIRHIYLPKLRSHFFGGMTSLFGMTWKVVAAAEVLSVPRNAIGSILQSAQVHLESPRLFAASFSLVLMSLACEFLLRFFCRLMSGSRKKSRPIPSGKLQSGSKKFSSADEEAKDITIRNLTLSAGNKKIFENFSVSFEAKKTTALLAPSGTGKTTLLNHIALHKKDFSCGSVSFLFQEPRLLENLTCLENLLVPLKNKFGSEALDRAKKYLESAGLLSRSDSFPSELSGGEKQRLAMARAFSFPGELLLLDEPFQSQDLHSKILLMELLSELLKNEKRTAIVVTHDVFEATAISDRIIALKGSPVKIALEERISREDSDNANGTAENFRKNFTELNNTSATKLFEIML